MNSFCSFHCCWSPAWPPRGRLMEKSPGERSRPSTPSSVRPSTPPSPVGLASTPRTTLAAVGEKSPGERSRPGLSSGDVNHNTVDVKPNLAVRVEDVKPLALTINAIKCSSGIYKLIKTSRTITALEGLRLASNQVITQLEYDLDLVYDVMPDPKPEIVYPFNRQYSMSAAKVCWVNSVACN